MSWIVLIGALVALKLLLLLLVAGRWGYHRDEPYYVVGGRHPAWGYVDHPPMTPVLARLSDAAFGGALSGLRLLPALASSSLLVVAAATARQLGGSDRAAVLAAVAALACPLLLASGHWFQTVPFDQLLGALAVLVWIHLLGGGDARWWLALGALLGLALENKWTVLLVVAAIGIGTLSAAELRGDLATVWPWVGVVVAVGLWAPNLLWQMDHDWPTLRFIRGNSTAWRHDEGWSSFLWQQLGVLGVPLLVLAVAGLVWAWGEATWRPAMMGVGLVLVALAVIGSKPYYHGPFLPFLFAAGALAIDGWVASSQTRLAGSIAIWGLLALPFTLPVLSPSVAANVGIFSVNDELAEELGWSELADQVAAVMADLPASEWSEAKILSRSYGEAAALELLGPERGIPPGAALSGHNSYINWWPPDEPAGTVIAVRFDPADLSPFFKECERVDHVRNQVGVKNQAAGVPILVCRGLEVTPEELRDAVRLNR
jgi:4-amino-4-deoxy-L-arabinose transferase-like glycosyltransferase